MPDFTRDRWKTADGKGSTQAGMERDVWQRSSAQPDTHLAESHEDQVPLQVSRTLIPTLWGDIAKSLQRAGGAAGAGGTGTPSEASMHAQWFL